MNISIFNLLLIAGVIQGFVFNIVTLINRKKISKVIIFLNLTVFFLSLNNLQAWLIESGYSSNIFFIKKLLVPWYMLIFPMFYMFLINYLKVKDQLKNILKISLAIFCVQLLIRILLISYVFYYKTDLRDSLISDYNSVEEIFNAVFGFLIVFKSSYLVFKQKEVYDYVLKFDDIKWIKIFLILGGVIIFFWVFAIVIQNINGNKFAYYPLRLSTSVLLYWIGYQGLYRYNILNDRISLRHSLNSDLQPILGSNIGSLEIEVKDYISEKHQQDFNLINDYVLNNQKFLDSYLSMDNLSNELNMSTSHFSKIVNGLSGYNFSDYINSFRVEQAKKLLSDEAFDKYTIVAIGLECGFNSKSTFYNAFKKFTLQTPTQFRSKN
ncbi:AraC family transcriptional regulator [uncultured Lacinutrix sp.]|uniref:helix-turn-helix domain-containing protein n=1 Tax=uncultured Lacinutrix sp. TaxID=574032 RepID=UPI002630D11E|nr:helix-turn-helix domain-containing protein [uncultured Lacinutrix sp.]